MGGGGGTAGSGASAAAAAPPPALRNAMSSNQLAAERTNNLAADSSETPSASVPASTYTTAATLSRTTMGNTQAFPSNGLPWVEMNLPSNSAAAAFTGSLSRIARPARPEE